jgi:diguanylate cyclase (GGDEF)-like protein
MRALAHSDPLTGLANRRSLSEALNRALAGCGADNLLAVFVIDLDNFKPVNDRYGHDIGDELLVGVSQRIKESVRTGDIVSRLGGDEFVILASGLRNESQAAAIGEGLLAAFREPVKLSEAREVSVGLTVGYAIAPTHGLDSVTLLKLADDAMYSGKQRGKGALSRA